jgi:histidine triad (HIT) family protein
MACPFCQIAAREQPARVVYEDERVIAFHDANPMAPVHILIIPREHISGPLDFGAENAPIVGYLVIVAAQVARQEGIAEDGYRLVLNQGRNGGQSVFHVHLHLLGGRRMLWPPG